jgi:hypothetical protein
MTDGPSGAPASAQLLHRAGEVLMTCADSVTRIEGLVLPMVEGAAIAPDRVALQEIDLLRQRLVDVATCLTRISDLQTRNEPLDPAVILAPLRLDALRNRLLGQETDTRSPQDDCIVF